MQQRNLLVFFILTFLIFTSWSFIESRIWPRKPRPRNKTNTTQAEKPLRTDPMLWADVTGRAAFPGIPGLGTAAALATDVGIAEWASRERSGMAIVLARQAREAAKAKAKPAQVNKREEVALGGEGFNFDVVLTTRGAGVQSLILNQFKAANELGRPENETLHLIPQGLNRNDPSYVLFHYGVADDAQPLDTLGEMDWAIVKKEAGPDATTQRVAFAADVPGKDIRIVRTYTLEKGTYHLGLEVEIQRLEGNDTQPIKFRYQMTSGHGLPIEGVWYTSVFRNSLVGVVENSRNVYRDLQDSNSIGTQAGGNQVQKRQGQFIQYAGVVIQYFASMIVVDDQQQKKDFLAWARPTVEGVRNTAKPFLDDITTRVITEPVDLKPGDKVVHKYLLYNGPVKVRQLSELGAQSISPELAQRYLSTLHLQTMQDYGGYGWWTSVIIFFTNIMHDFLGVLHLILPNYGLDILALTVLVRAAMFPVSRKQAQMSAKMQALQPQLKELQKKYGNDKQAMGMAQMELYRKHGVSPFGTCWILILQMPIFMGLYYSLQESIHLRLAPFLYIKNLAAPDMLIWWGEHIPWISTPASQGGFLYLGPFFNLLPVIAVALMLVQQKLTMPPPVDEEQALQQMMMKWMMGFFGLVFYKVPAGLCLYFIISSGWGLAERKMLPKAKPHEPPQQARGAARHKPKPNDGNGTGMRLKEMWEEILRKAEKK